MVFSQSIRNSSQTSLEVIIDDVLRFAQHQFECLCHEWNSSMNEYPIQGFLNHSKWSTFKIKSSEDILVNVYPPWTVGFFPGILWQLYEFTGNQTWLERALKSTENLHGLEFNDKNHDVGFQIMSSYGEAYRLTANHSYKPIIVQAADSLASRFNENVGCIRSWHLKTDKKDFLVIVDNMMNLDLLWQAYDFTGNKTYKRMAISHANRTLHEHIRNDHSSYHVVNFNQTSGEVLSKFTAQGYSNDSCWSRGQAWLMLGFTRTYRASNMKIFLETAQNVAKYFIEHLPNDLVAPWDFMVPHDSAHAYIPRDISATVVATLALFELYDVTNNVYYKQKATLMAESIITNKYFLANRNDVLLPALLGNSTISAPNADPKRSDLALVYAEYYFLKMFHHLKKHFPYDGNYR